MSDFAIETAGLRKSFKGQAALNGLDLKVPTGSIFGFLGRNGLEKRPRSSC
jgi:ABC-2 type transport system ATP-binding protein